MTNQTEKRLLAGILALFVLLGATYSVIVPPFEASDEKWHYPMVKYIADHWALPVQRPGVETPWRQEGSQPPLYYFIGALATFWIDTSDMSEVRHLNPHVGPGAASDGNVNLAVHRPGREAFPWQGTILAVHLVRFLSVLMAAAGVYLTYRIVREVLPEEPALALGAAAIHAFTPMVVFIAGSVNNDNLVVPLSSLALLMLTRTVNERVSESASQRIGETSASSVEPPANQRGVRWKPPVIRYLLLGVVLGLAALTKTSSLGLTVLTAVVVTVRAVRRPEPDFGELSRAVEGCREFIVGGLCTLLPLLAIAGWWYARNLRLYGDLTGLSAFIGVLGEREVPAGLAQLWRERFSFLAGYWGNFGGLNVPMASWIYAVLNAAVVLAGVGLIVALVKSQIQKPKTQRARTNAEGLGFGIWNLGFVVCLLWGLGVLIPWALWARVTWSSQGRLVFAALPVWSMLLALGLSGWLPRRWGRWAVATFALFLLGLSAAAPFVWIRPAYALPEPLTDAQAAAIPHPLNVQFDNVMRLLGYDLETETVKPGGQVAVTLYWEALAPAEEDHVVFVHLLGKHDLLIAQRDTFPGLGLLSTTWLEPGSRWADRYVVPVPATAYAPDEAQIEVGLYNATGGARLPAVRPDGEPLGDNVRFGEVDVRPRSGDVPNPIALNFGDRMLLTGYDLNQRVVRPGETITLTLYWRGLRAMGTNYTISTQLVDEAQRKAAQQDSWPLSGDAPTAAWEPGQLLTERRILSIFPDAPPGSYAVRITVYTLREGGIVHLPVIPEGGRMLSTYVELTQVRVTP